MSEWIMRRISLQLETLQKANSVDIKRLSDRQSTCLQEHDATGVQTEVKHAYKLSTGPGVVRHGLPLRRSYLRGCDRLSEPPCNIRWHHQFQHSRSRDSDERVNRHSR